MSSVSINHKQEIFKNRSVRDSVVVVHHQSQNVLHTVVNAAEVMN